MSAETQLLSWMFWGPQHTSEAPLNLCCIQLFLPQTLHLYHSLPLQDSHAAGVQRAIPVTPINGAQQQSRVPSRFCNAVECTGCHLRHWGQIPLFFNTTLIQKQTSFLSGSSLADYLTPNFSDILQETVRNSEGKLCLQGCDHNCGPQIFYAQ